MHALYATTALTASGWLRDVRLSLDAGRIVGLEAGARPLPGDECHQLLLPGMPNVHSHAFQRGMAGLTEVRGSMPDSFWTWRDAMYRYALAITPDQLQAVATHLYVEMLEAGFTRVGEFHYLHHDPVGRPYGDIAEMAGRIAAAASQSGIGLTLLPVFYAHADFGGAPPTDGQRRFVNGLDPFGRLIEGCRRHLSGLDFAVLGLAPHSLRAVTPAELTALQAMATDAPIHIHAAEQVKEVEDCLAWAGRRPVEWLLERAPLDRRWCLIHATHMTREETRQLAASGAVAGLCPVTEANLGDGIFNGPSFAAAGGRLGIGSDSNILVAITDELRQLETSQRLRDRARNVLAAAGGSTSRTLYERAVTGGAQALGAGEAGIRVGARADLVTLDLTEPSFAGRREDTILDTWIFAGCRAIDCVWVGGRKLVEGGRHRARDGIARRFRRVMEDLAAL